MAYSSVAQVTIDETSTQPTSLDHQELSHIKATSHAKREIVLAILCVSLPMVILGGVLIYFIQRYGFDQSDPWFDSLERRDAAQDSSAFYVNMSATRFVTVASWISNIAASMSGLIMFTFSYPVARNFLRASEGIGSYKHCPTPFQLSLFLRAQAGSTTGLWEMVKYTTWRRRAGACFMLTHTAVVLLTAFILSCAIWGLDTWLHVSTTATWLTRSLADDTMYHNYSRQISCNASLNTYNSCSTNSHGIAATTRAFEILNNMSDTNMVSTYQDRSQTFAYVTDAQIERGHVFVASTLAINTQCTPISPSSCDYDLGLDDSAAYIDWQTSCNNFTTEVTALRALIGMNSSVFWLDRPDIAKATSIDHATTNPFYFAVSTVSGSFNTKLLSDNRTQALLESSDSFIGYTLNCTSTVYTIQYRWTNGSFFNVTSSAISNDIMGNTFSAPFQTGIGMSTVLNAAATAVGMDTMEVLADTFATVFSKTAMSLAASVVSSQANLTEGETVEGARVPKRPLIALLTVMLLYVILGSALGIWALICRDEDVDNVQAELTIAGIVATCFEASSAQAWEKQTEDPSAEHVGSRGSIRLRMTRPQGADKLQWAYTMSSDDGGTK